MFQLTQFMDGDNIVIVDKVPYYRYTGVTYLERLKNGLSLDYVFQLQDFVPQENERYEEPKLENKIKYFDVIDDYEENYEFCEKKEFETILNVRNGKKWHGFKKRQSRNMKKSTIKSNGYSFKLFANEQELPDLFDESKIDINYDDVSILSYEDRYYSYHSDYNNYYYDEYFDY